MSGDPALPLTAEPLWPIDAGNSPILLMDAASDFEEQLLRGWAARHSPQDLDARVVPISSARRSRPVSASALERVLLEEPQSTLVPLRVVWLPPERKGRRSFRLADLFRFGDLRDPPPWRQRRIFSKHRDLVRIVIGPCATVDEVLVLRDRQVDAISLVDFVVRRAHLALEKAERELRGSRYKVPRFLKEEILNRAHVRQELVKLASEIGRPTDYVERKASDYLDEIAASHSTYAIDIVANAIHWLYRQGYRNLHFEDAAFANVSELASQYPIVFLPSHRSNLDHLVLAYLLWQHGLPPTHTAGGINMNFFPVGSIVRRTGVFFIRRSFSDNAIYKMMLTSYLDYLIEKRFPLEWYLEGGRSRSGKLQAPRYGMLHYVADAYRRGKSDDVMLLPVSIAYDQIQDVAAYAAEQRGESKEAESLGWLMRAVLSLRKRHGSIHVRFGEPLSLAKELDKTAEGDQWMLEIQKTAFEVMARINRVTPITATANLVTALLASDRAALTESELRDAAETLSRYAEERGLPVAEGYDLRRDRDFRSVLAILSDHGLIESFSDGPQPVYLIGRDHDLEAAYYRNNIVHYFVTGGIAEVAVLGAGYDPDPVDNLWMRVLALRDLLKFEFFFSEKDQFLDEISFELGALDPDWEARVAQGSGESMLSSAELLRAHWALRPWLEGYRVVADELAMRRQGEPAQTAELMEAAVARGQQYVLQARISAESASPLIYQSAIDLAVNRGLIGGRTQDGREELAAEIEQALEHIDRLHQLASAPRRRA